MVLIVNSIFANEIFGIAQDTSEFTAILPISTVHLLILV